MATFEGSRTSSSRGGAAVLIKRCDVPHAELQRSEMNIEMRRSERFIGRYNLRVSVSISLDARVLIRKPNLANATASLPARHIGLADRQLCVRGRNSSPWPAPGCRQLRCPAAIVRWRGTKPGLAAGLDHALPRGAGKQRLTTQPANVSGSSSCVPRAPCAEPHVANTVPLSLPRALTTVARPQPICRGHARQGELSTWAEPRARLAVSL